MEFLPNFDNVFIPDEKISGYCLNPRHERGQHKAKIFKSVFGITEDDAELLKSEIIKNLGRFEILSQSKNKFGRIYTVLMEVRIFNKGGKICTAWMIENGTDFPRFIVVT